MIEPHDITTHNKAHATFRKRLGDKYGVETRIDESGVVGKITVFRGNATIEIITPLFESEDAMLAALETNVRNTHKPV